MKRLPLVINTEMFIQSVEHKIARAKSRILGARHGEFIIIDTPILQFSDRLVGQLKGEIQCKFTQEGDVYDFLSTVLKHMDEGVSLIAYPQTFQQTRLRTFPRIRVNIETRLAVAEKGDTLTVNMTDISAGGCKLEIPYLYGVAPDTACTLSFTLPDNRDIENLKGAIRNIRMIRLRQRTELGVSFLEPASEMDKIASFCRFCMFFEV
jgi:c-di-GMP-binding flagellar brake protein YcgR